MRVSPCTDSVTGIPSWALHPGARPPSLARDRAAPPRRSRVALMASPSSASGSVGARSAIRLMQLATTTRARCPAALGAPGRARNHSTGGGSGGSFSGGSSHRVSCLVARFS